MKTKSGIELDTLSDAELAEVIYLEMSVVTDESSESYLLSRPGYKERGRLLVRLPYGWVFADAMNGDEYGDEDGVYLDKHPQARDGIFIPQKDIIKYEMRHFPPMEIVDAEDAKIEATYYE